MFWQRDFLGTPIITYFYLPISARAYLFSQSVKIIISAAAPLVLTPFVRNQTNRKIFQGEPRGLRGAAGRAQSRKEPVRFDSFRLHNFWTIIVLVRFGLAIVFSASMRFGLRFFNASWFRPVRFGSVPRPVLAGSKIKRFGSVRFGRFGPVSYSFL